MARKNRSLASFDDVATSNNNNDNKNVNDNVNINDNKKENNDVNNDDYIDNIINGTSEKKKKPVLTGVYLDPDIAKTLDSLGKKAGRGGKSKITNEALRKVFEEKGLL